jgi:hypothetical protein
MQPHECAIIYYCTIYVDDMLEFITVNMHFAHTRRVVPPRLIVLIMQYYLQKMAPNTSYNSYQSYYDLHIFSQMIHATSQQRTYQNECD